MPAMAPDERGFVLAWSGDTAPADALVAKAELVDAVTFEMVLDAFTVTGVGSGSVLTCQPSHKLQPTSMRNR